MRDGKGVLIMGFDGSKRLTPGQIAALEAQIAEDIESGIAGGVYERITTLENRTDVLAKIVADEHDSWANIAALVRSGSGPAAFKIGEQLETTWKDKYNDNNTEYTVAQNICHLSDNLIFSDDGGETTETGNGIFLQWHYTTPHEIPFDAREALYTAPAGGLSAGTYYFKVTGLVSSWDSYAQNNNKTFMFTLTGDLPEGAMLMLSAAYSTVDWIGTNIYVVDSCYAPMRNNNYGDDGFMPLSLWDGSSGAPLTGNASAYSTGANGLNHIQRALVGYNRWSQSAIRQYLNSAAPCRVYGDEENYPGWWRPQNEFDRIPSQAITYTNTYADPVTTNVGKPGFLSGYDADFIAAMRTVRVQNSCNTVTDGGITEYTWDKVFLPSLTEMNIQPQATEGVVWDYYKQLFAANPVSGRTNWAQNTAYPILKGFAINAKTTAAIVRLRSAYRTTPSGAWIVNTSGNVYNYYATYAYRQRPACVIG